jgi:hypothetical protein
LIGQDLLIIKEAVPKYALLLISTNNYPIKGSVSYYSRTVLLSYSPYLILSENA